MDKVATTTDFDQAYIKKTNGDQEMQDMSPAAIANTLALRTTNARLKIGDAVDDNDAVTLRQLKNNLKPFKVKDVTLDGTSIVNTETGVVALESTYSTTLTGQKGTLTQEEYNNLDGDNASYIWYKTSDTDTTPIRLTKTYKTTTSLSYQVISNGTLIVASLFKTNYSWSVSTHPIEVATNKVTTIDSSSTNAQYPSAQAVYKYVTTELGKIDQFKYKVSTDAASTPEDIVWYSGATESTKITGTLTASANTEYIIYLVPCKHTASETQKGYDEYLTIKNSAGQYVWEVLGNTRDLDLSDYVSKTATGTQIIASDLRIKAGNKFTTYGNGTIGYTTDNGVTEYVLNLPQKGGIIAVTEDLKQYVTLEKDEYIVGHKTFGAGLTADAIATFNASARFNEDLTLACPVIINNNAGTDGQVLTSQGDGKAPQWTTISVPTSADYMTSTSATQDLTDGIVKRVGASKSVEWQLNNASSFTIRDNVNGTSLFSVVRNSTGSTNVDVITIQAPLSVSLSVGTVGQVLTSQGAGKAPQWTTIPQGTVKKYVKDITVPAGGTNAPVVTITHDLNVTGCTVSLYQNNELVMADIQIVDKNNIKIIFGQTFATAQTFQVVVTG